MSLEQTTSVVLVGVGGQGILLASEIVAQAAMKAGFDVKTNEVHGMAQRGGSVIAQIRYGKKVFSPLVAKGTAKVLGALERIEALRYADYLADDGLVVVNSQMMIPVTVSMGAGSYPEDAKERLVNKFKKLIYIDAAQKAVELGNIKAANVVTLGAISTGLDLPLKAWHEAIEASVPAKFKELNIKAFDAGRQQVLSANLFHNKEMETSSVDQIRSLQTDRLRKIVKHVYKSNDVQKKRFNEAGINPADIKTLDDLTKIPFMDKNLLRDTYPMGLSCTDRNTIVEMHMSSGSTGTPVVMPYTKADLDQWAECMARCLVMAGGRKGNAIQITPSFGLFNGGFGFYHGARAADFFVIPTSSGNTARQIRLARDFGTTILAGVVSYGIRIMEVLQEQKEELPDLKIGIFGAEVFSESMKEKIQTGMGIEAFDIYGMTETGGVGTLGMDCKAHNGLHVWEDHYIVEVIDPNTKKTVADGQFGELVVTSLTRQALPVIRLRTGDLTRVVSREKCDCGRTHVKIAPVTGRVDDMLIVKGVNFWPRQVEQTLMQIPGVGSNYQIVIEEENGVKDVRINVEAEPSVTGHTVVKALKEVLGFSPKGDVYPIGELPRQEGKAKRVFYKNQEE